MQKVLSCNYNLKGDKIILSACKNGQTDLFEFSVLGNSLIQITNDPFDDLHPKYRANSNVIIFSSNMSGGTTTPQNNSFDLYEVNKLTSKVVQLTNTPLVNEIQPQPKSKFSYHYLSNINGINNHYKKATDSTISHIDTVIHYRKFQTPYQLSNFDRNIQEIDIYPQTEKFIMLYKKNGKYQFLTGDLKKQTIFENNDEKTRFASYSSHRSSIEGDTRSYNEDSLINIYNYTFESEKKKKYAS